MPLSYDLIRVQFLNRIDFPVWLPFLLTLVGTLGCIYTASVTVPEALQHTLFITELSSGRPDNQLLQNTAASLSEQKEENKIRDGNCPPLFILSFNKNSLTPQLKEKDKKINQLKEWLGLHPRITIVLGGHSSSKGSKEHNLILSYRRAKAVQRFFIESGIAGHRLAAQAFGEEKPIAGIPSSSERNRRVSMHVKGMNECQNHTINE